MANSSFSVWFLLVLGPGMRRLLVALLVVEQHQVPTVRHHTGGSLPPSGCSTSGQAGVLETASLSFSKAACWG